ncbi:MAG: hypothetical protein J5965_18380, partial [Aeriscardovia sp.]|nr:hypothetical protein [Aeriscardovia sp.]
MDISPAGYLYILLLGYLILHQRNRFYNLFVLTLVTEVFLGIGYIIKIGKTALSFEGVIQYVIIAYCLFNIKHIPLKLKRGCLLLMGSFIIPILLLYLFPSNALVTTMEVSWDEVLFDGASLVHPAVTGFVLKSNVKVLLMTLVFVYIYINWSVKDYQKSLRIFSGIANIFLILGIIEFCVRNILGLNEEWGSLLEFFWGESDNTVYESLERGTAYGLNLFTKEPSHYVNTLLIICIAKLTNNVINGKSRIIDNPILIALLLMLLSTAFSAVYTSGVFLVIYFMYRWYIIKPKTMQYEKISVLVILLVVISSLTVLLGSYTDSYIVKRLLNLNENLGDMISTDWDYGFSAGDKSAQIRMVSTIQTLITLFTGRPVFGYSYNAIICHSAGVQLLAGIGLFGM